MSTYRTMETYVAARAPHLATPRVTAPRHIATRAPRRGFSAGHLVAVAVLGALIGLWISPGRAYAGQVETADRDVSTVRVSYVEPIGARRLYVELNNGATYELNPCRFEDGRMCYWDAGSAGNGRGSSFVSVSGRVIYSAMIGDAR